MKPNATRIRFAVFVPWVLVAVLLVLNGLTLLSEQVHSAAYGVIESVVRLAGDNAARLMLERSPEQLRAKAVVRATRDLKITNANIETRQLALQSEHMKLQQTNAVLAKEHEALRTLTSRRAAAVKSLATRITAKLAARSAEAVASLPVRAVPYVGIAALVTFTGWEVKADCELARSLSELTVEHDTGPVDTEGVCKLVDKVPSAKQAWSAVKSQAGKALQQAYSVVERFAPNGGASIEASVK